jgi:hypothetical protein
MPLLSLQIEKPTPSLYERKDALMAAIEEQVGILGHQLYQTVEGKLSGSVLNVGTGALLNSVMLSAVAATGLAFETFVEIPDASPEWLIGMTHEYGGTSAYVIEPIEKQALSFVVGGTRVFARRVNHPPAQERSYLRSSLDEMAESIRDGIQETVNAVLGEV